jgi:membrane protein
MLAATDVRPSRSAETFQTLSMWVFFSTVKRASVRAFEHDVFGIAKGAAYSGIITLFPALLVLASVLAASHQTEILEGLVTSAVGRILPQGTSGAALRYFTEKQTRPIGTLITTSLLTMWTASGMMVTWMEGFRAAYQIPATWGIVKQRFIAVYLVILSFIPMTFATALVAFGNQIEQWMIENSSTDLSTFILLGWTGVRWIISALTSIAVIALIYHHAVPRTQKWHTVLPGATLATVIWFAATMIFGWYLTHVSEYSLIYGSVGVAISLLVWMYIVSLIVLFGAEFNALLFPRALSPESSDATETAERVSAT